VCTATASISSTLGVGVGNLKADYAATIVGQTDPAPVAEYDLSMYLRPSQKLRVTAVIDGDLPHDSIDQPVSIR
jgi:hypothetical protein